MTSKSTGIGERIADLSELMAAARKTLAELGDGDHPHTKLRRANLQATITTVQRELQYARQSLQGAGDLDAAAEILTRLKEARLAAISDHARTLDRNIPSDAIKAILTSANTKAKSRRAR